MAEPNSDPVFFKGTSPEECEVFVAAIRRRAFDQGKHRDDEWMAGLASTYFVEDAFYWYEELDKDVQNDWSQLRPALVARFGRRNTISTMAPSSSMMQAPTSSITIPTPAAAPPATSPRHSVRKGRLKVLNHNGSLQGYIAIPYNSEGVYDKLCTSPKDALKISFTVSSVGDEPFEVEIIDAPQPLQGGDKLAITWPNLINTEWIKNVRYHATCCSLSTTSSSEDRWAMERRVWKISEDGVLGIEYPRPDGSFETLQSSVFRPLNRIRWLRSSPDPKDSFPVRIVIEDAI